MKTTFFSLFLVLCLVCTSNAAAPTCGTVDSKAAPCITFASGKVKTPPPACCKGLKQLAGTVKTVDDKKAVCRCLKAGVKNFAGVQDRFLSQLPSVCQINVGFPVSLNTDCEKIH